MSMTTLQAPPSVALASVPPATSRADQWLAISEIVITTLKDAAQLAPLPYLQAASGLALGILQSVNAAKKNKDDFQRLAEDACELVYSVLILPSVRDGVELSEDLVHNLISLSRVLQQIHNFCQSQASRNFVKRALLNKNDADKIKDYRERLRHSLDIFGLQSHVSIRERVTHTAKQQDDIYRILHQHYGVPSSSEGHIPSRSVERAGDANTLLLIGERPIATHSKDVQHELTSAKFYDSMLPRWARLPPSPKIFMGRDHELDASVSTLCSESKPCSSLAILGPGGIGKSTVAHAILHDPRILKRFGPRRLFVRCDAANTADSLVAELASCLRLTGTNLFERFVAVIRELHRPTLLVLDNFETPWENFDTRKDVEEILSSLCDVSCLSLVVTMRGAERPYGPLWTRPCLAPLGPLGKSAARQMFIEISDLPADHPVLDTLLSVVDYHPLSITLLARFAQYESPSEILERWKTARTSMLKDGPADKLHSVDMSVRVSWESPRMAHDTGARDVLSVLSSLPEGVHNDHLSSLFPSISDVKSSVATLLQTSLAYRGPDDRLRVLAPVREFVMKYHPAPPSLFEPVRIHYQKMSSLTSNLGKAGSRHIVELLTTEIGNVQSVFLTALRFRDPSTADVIRAVIHLSDFMEMSGLGSMTVLEAAMEAAIELHDTALHADCLFAVTNIQIRRGANVSSSKDALDQARVLYETLGDLRGQARCTYHASFDMYSDEETLNRALSLYVQANDHAGAVDCYGTVAIRMTKVHDHTKAAEALKCAEKHANEAGSLLTTAVYQYKNANCCIMAGDLNEASIHLEKCLALFNDVGDQNWIGDCLFQLGDVASHRALYRDAIREWTASLQQFIRIGRMDSAVWAHLGLAETYLKLSEFEEALDHCHAALILNISTGRDAPTIMTHLKMGTILVELGRSGDATEHADRVLELSHILHHSSPSQVTDAIVAYWNASCHQISASAAFVQGQLEGAVEHFNATSFLLESIAPVEASGSSKVGHVARRTLLCLYLGRLAAAQGDLPCAMSWYEYCLFLSRDIGSWKAEAEALEAIGDILFDSGDSHPSAIQYNSAMKLFQQGTNYVGSRRCERKLEVVRARRLQRALSLVHLWEKVYV